MHNLTQEALDQEIGVARHTILAIEKGKYDPFLDLAFRLARHFDVRIDELFALGEESSAERDIQGGIPDDGEIQRVEHIT